MLVDALLSPRPDTRRLGCGRLGVCLFLVQFGCSPCLGVFHHCVDLGRRAMRHFALGGKRQLEPGGFRFESMETIVVSGHRLLGLRHDIFTRGA